MIISLDAETTTYNKGNPYDERNKLVCYGVDDGTASKAWLWNDVSKVALQSYVDDSELVLGFNIKFDLNWFCKLGIDFSRTSIWDVQIAEFVLEYQLKKFPSLNETCIKYGIPVKKDVVKEEYWAKGIQTDEIPWPILEEYQTHDCTITRQCYLEQLKRMSPEQIKLVKMMCFDLTILREMESNGLRYDEQLCQKRSEEIEQEIAKIREQLSAVYPEIPINFNSGDQLSAFLYGGQITETTRVHDGFYKTGKKAGELKYKKMDVVHTLPRMFNPLQGTELKKDGFFATDTSTLKKLKGKRKDIINLLLQLSKLEKLNSTYYVGLPELNKDMHWPPGVLHSQLNQTLATTGRLSSSNP